MIYLYWYLGVGIAVGVLAYFDYQRTQQKPSDSLAELLDAVMPEPKDLSYRIRKYMLAPAAAAITITLLWPVAVCMYLKDIFWKDKEPELKRGREFAVAHDHLQQQLSVQGVEAREIVNDPLGAVPNIPFGHLNPAWRTFLANHSDDDALWSFTARWENALGGEELKAGYVFVHDGVPLSHFLTISKTMKTSNESKKA